MALSVAFLATLDAHSYTILTWPLLFQWLCGLTVYAPTWKNTNVTHCVAAPHIWWPDMLPFSQPWMHIAALFWQDISYIVRLSVIFWVPHCHLNHNPNYQTRPPASCVAFLATLDASSYTILTWPPLFPWPCGPQHLTVYRPTWKNTNVTHHVAGPITTYPMT